MSATVRARLGRYGVWQLRDYFLGAGGATLVVSVVVIALLSQTSFGTISTNGHQSSGQDAVRSVTGVLLIALGVLGSTFANSGLVADDRARGYYRFALAKPVSPVRLYGQAFLVRGVGFLCIAAIAWVACAWRLLPGSFFGTLGYMVVAYVTVGGVTLLLSTMFRHAWLGTLILWVAAAIFSAAATTPGGLRVLWLPVHFVLPPLQLTSRLASMLVSGDAMPTPVGDLVWYVGYGVLAILAALTVIRGREWPL
jgi:hypothetical protein